MEDTLGKIEQFLGKMFSEQFASAILKKQLQNINETRESFTDEKVQILLKQLEEKVLKDFYGNDTSRIMSDLKRSLRS